MKTATKWIPIALVLVLLTSGFPVSARTIQFGGHDWAVRSGQGGPGPNSWDEANVWLDASGGLHLRIALRDGKWSCAELTMQRRLGFGRYQFQVEGQLDRFDDNVVLGLFNYPTRDVGGDAPHEIDVEFARWSFEPADPLNRIAQKPMPVHINLWLFKGQPPKDGKEVEVVIRSFKYTSR